MPMHDWTRVRAGTYHNFHYRWIAAIMDQLNAGILPAGYFAMAEQVIGGSEPHVVTLQLARDTPVEPVSSATTIMQPKTKPSTSFVMTADIERYARKANWIVVRHELGQVLAVIEILSPGNKDSRHAIRSFVEKSVDLLFDGVNLLIIDPLPPTPRDPQGIHPLIWSEVTDEPFELPVDRRLTIVAYQAGPIKTAYIEPIAIGSPLPKMPLFLQGDYYVELPLETTSTETWDVLPNELKRLVDSPAAGK